MATIAIDLHGGDFGPSVIVPSSLRYFQNHPEHYGVLFGDLRICKPSKRIAMPSNVEWVDTDTLDPQYQVKPSKLLRHQSTSSIEIATMALANADVDVLVSAEHTGVMLSLMAKYGHLHPSLDRPVLTSWLPTAKGRTLMLDLGASFSATCEQLTSFASIGLGLQQSLVHKPKVALLNIGAESFKGLLQLRLAAEQLTQWRDIEFCGFIEPSELYLGLVDIVVTDGFTGNTAIKSAEGAVNLVVDRLKEQFSGRWLNKVLGMVVRRRLSRALSSLDPDRANGALIAGSDLMLVKSHGHANATAFESAITQAQQYASERVAHTVWLQLDRISS